jgi:hypothetical protein
MRRQGYQGRDGLTRSAPTTFDSKRSAEPRLTLMEGRILRGEWQPPEQSKIMFGGYATHWVADRQWGGLGREYPAQSAPVEPRSPCAGSSSVFGRDAVFAPKLQSSGDDGLVIAR